MSLRVLVIVGPTACGKTRLGVEVAHRLGSEIVSADSRQVYRGLDIGTGKDLHEYAAVHPPVSYHLIDVAEPDEVYTLFRYQQDCFRVLRELGAREPFVDRRVPVILVGGSGLYVEAVVRQYRLADVPRNDEMRIRLQDRDREELLDELVKQDPEMARETDTSSRRRLIRALEIVEHGREHPLRWSEPAGVPLKFDVFGIDVSRHELCRRIGARLRQRLEGGMVEEVRDLLARGIDPGRLDELGLEYREVTAYLLGRKSRSEMLSDLEAAIGRFAKRQRTWFRGMERRGVPIRWISSGDAEQVVAAYGAWR